MIENRIKNDSFFEEVYLDEQVNQDTIDIIEVEIDNSIEIEQPPSENANESTKSDFYRLINTENGSNKFWEAAVQENKLIVRYGRTGTKGQVQVKTFDHNIKAIAEKEKLYKEKLGKGYQKI